MVGPSRPHFNCSGLFQFQASAQPYHLSPSGVQQVNEGGKFVFDCTVETGSPRFFFVLLDGSVLSTRFLVESIPRGSRFTIGPVASNDDRSVLQCSVGNVFTVESATLDVICECYSMLRSLIRRSLYQVGIVRLCVIVKHECVCVCACVAEDGTCRTLCAKLCPCRHYKYQSVVSR